MLTQPLLNHLQPLPLLKSNFCVCYLCVYLKRVEQQERDDEEMCVKPKSGRSAQQKKKPSKQAKKTDSKPKAEPKKPVVVAENKESKKAQAKGGKGKKTDPKTSEKSDDSFEFDEGESAAPMSLAARLAKRQKPLSSSSSSSGTESSSKAKKQATLERFGSKKAPKKRAQKEADDSDDDLIMEFSEEDEEEISAPAVKRTARAAAAKKVSNKYDCFLQNPSFLRCQFTLAIVMTLSFSLVLMPVTLFLGLLSKLR